MAELTNFWLRPCVVWKTPLPTPGKNCMSPDFLLLGSSYYLYLEKYGDASCNLSLHKRTLSEQDIFRVTTFIQESEWLVSHVLYGVRTVYDKYTIIWSGTRDDIAKCMGEFAERERQLKIVCLFDIDPKLEITCVNETIHLSTKRDSPLTSVQGSSDSSKSKLSSDKGVQASLFVPGKLESLSLDFCNLLEHETLADVKLRCGDSTIAAHRAVLATRSEVFAAMFRNKMAESETGIVDVTDLDVSHFNLFMKYVYSGKISDLSEDAAQSLYAAGDKYAVHSLKAACSEWMVGNLTEENCLGFLILADRHSDEGLKQSVVDFVVERLEVLRKEAWSRFSEEHPRLAIIVYQKQCAATLSKQV